MFVNVSQSSVVATSPTPDSAIVSRIARLRTIAASSKYIWAESSPNQDDELIPIEARLVNVKSGTSKIKRLAARLELTARPVRLSENRCSVESRVHNARCVSCDSVDHATEGEAGFAIVATQNILC